MHIYDIDTLESVLLDDHIIFKNIVSNKNTDFQLS